VTVVETQLSALIVSNDAQTTHDIAEAMDALGDVSLQGTYPDLARLAVHLEREPVRAVVVDLGAEPDQALRELQSVIGRFHDSRFMVLAESLTDGLMTAAMEVGARYLLTKSGLRSDLPGMFERLREAVLADRQWQGMSATILSSGGGCGSTTIAVNLASELNLLSAKPVLLADMDYAYGTVSTYLGLTGRYGLADVFNHGEEADQSLIRSSALKFNEGLDVLISPASISDREMTLSVQPETVEHVLKVCKDAYDYCVIDAPRVPMNVAAALARSSAITYVVLQPQVKDVRICRRIVNSLVREYGIPMDQIALVMNRFRQRKGALLGLTEAKEAIGDIVIECVNNDYDSAVSAIDYGQPLSAIAPKSPLRKDLQRLAEQILAARQLQAP